MKNKTSLDKLHIEFKKTHHKLSEKNWPDQLNHYLDKVAGFSGNQKEERIVKGWIAGICEKAYYIAAHKKSKNTRIDFNKKIIKILKTKNSNKIITKAGSIICGKKQPSLAKNILPTLDRFDIMESLPEIFAGGVESIIIGGSMSYIPFLGIREDAKNNDFSDIDTVIVVNNNFFKPSFAKNFSKNKLFPAREKNVFLERIKIFQKLYKKNKADVFSQRFSINEKKFTISNHFMTRSVFKKMMQTEFEKKRFRQKKNFEYIMQDFRTDYFAHPCHARHTFNGQRIESVIKATKLKKGGFISNVPGYIINNGKYYPGVYQTVISPAFLVFYDRNGETTKLVKEFEKILYREVKNIRKKETSSTYAKAHNRYDIFPLGRYD
ncbi:hypothetical protein C0580_01060 [Candidatus Parcubacteria bacterium]|nr:MAG: hypothetical protein C0580_01060 [Candidatus Parcubacteria bacterium]